MDDDCIPRAGGGLAKFVRARLFTPRGASRKPNQPAVEAAGTTSGNPGSGGGGGGVNGGSGFRSSAGGVVGGRDGARTDGAAEGDEATAPAVLQRLELVVLNGCQTEVRGAAGGGATAEVLFSSSSGGGGSSSEQQ